jgi:hypothetical protein
MQMYVVISSIDDEQEGDALLSYKVEFRKSWLASGRSEALEA